MRRNGVWGLQAGAGPMLSAMVQSLLSVFEAHRYATCLKTLTVAVEFFGGEADAASLLDYALTRSCSAAAPVYKVPLLGHRDTGAQWGIRTAPSNGLAHLAHAN